MNVDQRKSAIDVIEHVVLGVRLGPWASGQQRPPPIPSPQLKSTT
jgi:hypothetical protein